MDINSLPKKQDMMYLELSSNSDPFSQQWTRKHFFIFYLLLKKFAYFPGEWAEAGKMNFMTIYTKMVGVKV